MRIRKKTLYGRISPKGELKIHTDLMADFCRMHQGKAVIIRIEIQPTEPTDKQKAYYWGYIVPEVQGALMEIGEVKTKEQTDAYLRSLCPICENDEGRVREFGDLDVAEVGGYLDWVMQFAAEELHLPLEDAE